MTRMHSSTTWKTFLRLFYPSLSSVYPLIAMENCHRNKIVDIPIENGDLQFKPCRKYTWLVGKTSSFQRQALHPTWDKIEQVQGKLIQKWPFYLPLESQKLKSQKKTMFDYKDGMPFSWLLKYGLTRMVRPKFPKSWRYPQNHRSDWWLSMGKTWKSQWKTNSVPQFS